MEQFENYGEEFVEDGEVQALFSVADYLPSAPDLTMNPMNLPRVPETLSKVRQTVYCGAIDV